MTSKTTYGSSTWVQANSKNSSAMARERTRRAVSITMRLSGPTIGEHVKSGDKPSHAGFEVAPEPVIDGLHVERPLPPPRTSFEGAIAIRVAAVLRRRSARTGDASRVQNPRVGLSDLLNLDLVLPQIPHVVLVQEHRANVGDGPHDLRPDRSEGCPRSPRATSSFLAVSVGGTKAEARVGSLSGFMAGTGEHPRNAVSRATRGAVRGMLDCPREHRGGGSHAIQGAARRRRRGRRRRRVQELAILDKDCERLEQNGLTRSESEHVLRALQEREHQPRAFALAHALCGECGSKLPNKGCQPIVFRRLFGSVFLESPRLRRCACQPHETATANPLAELLHERTAPELLFMQTKWASLVSDDMTAKALQDFLPLEEETNPCTRRNPTLAVAHRCEEKLGDDQFALIEGCSHD
jgi:hypothetical protein